MKRSSNIRLLLAFFLIVFSVCGLAASVTFSNGKKSKDEYAHHKCVDGVFAVRALKAKLTSAEICQYGKQGCSSISLQDKMTVYCELSTLGECFEKKSWLAIDHILGIKLAQKPGLITYGLKKGSAHEGKTCAFWDQIN